MARKKNLRDLLTPEPTPDKINAQRSGWCMTNDHNGCPQQFSHGKCPCDCHTQKTQKAKEEVSIIADSDDPRPWRNK